MILGQVTGCFNLMYCCVICKGYSDDGVVWDRLGGLIDFAGVRRDGANLISKLVQPLLQILGDKDSCGIWVCTQGGLHFGVVCWITHD